MTSASKDVMMDFRSQWRVHTMRYTRSWKTVDTAYPVIMNQFLSMKPRLLAISHGIRYPRMGQSLCAIWKCIGRTMCGSYRTFDSIAEASDFADIVCAEQLARGVVSYRCGAHKTPRQSMAVAPSSSSTMSSIKAATDGVGSGSERSSMYSQRGGAGKSRVSGTGAS